MKVSGKRSRFEDCSSEYSFSCFSYCQELFLPNFCLSGSLNFSSPNPLQMFNDAWQEQCYHTRTCDLMNHISPWYDLNDIPGIKGQLLVVKQWQSWKPSITPVNTRLAHYSSLPHEKITLQHCLTGKAEGAASASVEDERQVGRGASVEDERQVGRSASVEDER